MKNKKNLIFIVLIFLCLLLTIAAVITFAYSQKGRERTNQETAKDTSQEENTISYQGETYRLNQNIQTILFLGIDKEAMADMDGNPGENGQSDSINLLVADVENKTGQFLQISRDTLTDIDIYSIQGEFLTSETGQIALQYAYGDGKEKSCYMTAEKVSDLLYGTEVRNFFALKMEGITAAADALGGIPVTVPKDYTAIDPAFCQGAEITLTGELAEKYVRAREVSALDSNADRMERQAQFMQALIKKIGDMHTDDSQTLSLYKKLHPYMVTNMTADRLREMSEYDISEEILSLPGQVREGADGYAEFIPDEEKTRAQVIELFYEKVGK